MWRHVLVVLLFSMLPACGQRFEVYGMGGYLRLDPQDASDGALIGGGVGVQILSILGFEGEFFHARAHNPSGLDWIFNIGQINLKLEPRRGRLRPYFVLGGGGGSYTSLGPPVFFSTYPRNESHTGTVSVQAGGGVSIQLTDRTYVRPQVRVHALGLQGAWSIPIAVGYRF